MSTGIRDTASPLPSDDGDDEHHHGERPPQGEDDRVHGLGPFGQDRVGRSPAPATR